MRTNGKIAFRTKAELLGFAALIAIGITAWTNSATGRTVLPEETTGEAAPRGDKLPVGGRAGCEMHNWPYIAPDCLILEDEAGKRATRTITIERRVGENTSALVRMPAELFETEVGETETGSTPRG